MSSPLKPQKSDDTDGNLLIFGAHVANLIILRSFQSFGKGEGTVALPFIERFEGSLLFVDISGFTALSRQLHVEPLKNHINAYFTKMLNVVDKYDGDVVKFAGDALYIVWPANALIDLTECARKALLCSLEISIVCNGYTINLDESHHWVSPRSPANSFMRSDDYYPKNISSEHYCTPSIAEQDDRFAFLNVHCGLSTGTMAAVDVGCAGRWEFLLVGEPLTDVAIAEGLAKSGEVVVSKKAFDLLNENRAFRKSEISSLKPSSRNLDEDSILNYQTRGDLCYLVWTETTLSLDTSDSSSATHSGGSESGTETPTPRNRLDFVDSVLREIHHQSKSDEEDFSVWKTKETQAQGLLFAMTVIKVNYILYCVIFLWSKLKWHFLCVKFYLPLNFFLPPLRLLR